MAEILIKLFLL